MTTPLLKPTTIVEPFANSGSKNAIPVTASATPGRASLDTGFPPLTMTPVVQGGVPPSGLDFNGILNWITQHTTWLNAGGQYTFDASLAAFIGGYPVGMVLQSNDGLSSYVNVQAGNTADFNADPSQIGTTWLPYGGAAVASSGRADITSTGGTFVLQGTAAVKRVIRVFGALTSDLTVVFPNGAPQTWVVQNLTTGSFAVRCVPSGGSSLPVTQGATNILYSTGNSMQFAIAEGVTRSPGDNSTFLANTAFVTAAIAAALVNTALTGTPTAPTAARSTNNTQIATTAYADRAASDIGAGSTPQYRNANFTAGITGDYWTDTSAAAFTMTLPDPPSAQNCLRVHDIAGTWGTNALTINPGTKTINGFVQNIVCDIPGETIELWYTGSDWRIL